MTKQTAKEFNFRQFSIYAAVAVLINSFVFLIGSATGASMVTNQNGAMEINLFMVIAITFLPLVVAGAIANLIFKRSPRFVTRFAQIGFAFGLLSMIALSLIFPDAFTAPLE